MLINSFQHDCPEAGCDEAGRGCLAGSVFAAAVILPPGFSHPLLNDSKQMTERNRNLLREIIENEAVAWAVQEITAARIDEINILNASFEGMSLAVAQLDPQPGFLAIDGNRFRTTLTIMHRQGRRQICEHSCSLGTGQDPSRRVHEAPRRRVPHVRLGEEQGLPDARAQTCHPEIRDHTVPQT